MGKIFHNGQYNLHSNIFLNFASFFPILIYANLLSFPLTREIDTAVLQLEWNLLTAQSMTVPHFSSPGGC